MDFFGGGGGGKERYGKLGVFWVGAYLNLLTYGAMIDMVCCAVLCDGIGLDWTNFCFFSSFFLSGGMVYIIVFYGTLMEEAVTLAGCVSDIVIPMITYLENICMYDSPAPRSENRGAGDC